VLGKNRMASGQEEACKACAVSFGSSQEGSVLLAVFLRSRPCSVACIYNASGKCKCPPLSFSIAKSKNKVYTGSHQRALRKCSQLVLTLASAPPIKRKKRNNRD